MKKWNIEKGGPREISVDPFWLDSFGEATGLLYKEEVIRRDRRRELFRRFFRKHDLIEFARKNLTARQFQVFEMHYLKGMGVTRIALKLGIRQPVVSHIIGRIGIRLRKKYIKSGILKK